MVLTLWKYCGKASTKAGTARFRYLLLTPSRITLLVSAEQLIILAPCLGHLMVGDRSFFLAIQYIHFPFFICEVKCDAGVLEVADRQMPIV